MSMICYLLGLTPTQIGALQAKPWLAAKVVTAAQDGRYASLREEAMSRMSPEQRKQFEAKQAAFETSPAMRDLKARTEEARSQVAAIGPFEQSLSLEKSWHVLHYLFTGHVSPANAPGDLLLSGQALEHFPLNVAHSPYPAWRK